MLKKGYKLLIRKLKNFKNVDCRLPFGMHHSKLNSTDIIFGNDLLTSLVLVIVVEVVGVEGVIAGLFLVLVLSAIVLVLEVVLSDLGNLDVAIKKTELKKK